MSALKTGTVRTVESLTPLPVPAPATASFDAESRYWLRSLRDEGARRDEAIARLHALASRFTTWAYKFALLEAAVKLRKRAWRGREVPLEPEGWDLFASAGLGVEAEAEQSELLSTLRRAIAEVLTAHQRRERGLALETWLEER